MRLILLTALTMVAFAANSLLNRAALADGATGPAAFAALRMASGALCLAGLMAWRRGLPSILTPGRWLGASALALYMIGFSFAYVALDAGVGALILFGCVQITMFAGGIGMGERPTAMRWLGTLVALGGLVWLNWPGAANAPAAGASLLMVAAALGWGIYSLIGRQVADPLQETAANFIVATPVAMLVWTIFPDTLSVGGTVLAIVSGAVTSGLGYALWYTVLPRLEATVAALSQLTVPVIAVAGGAYLLSEPVTLRLTLASAMILGGVAIGVLAQRRMSSSGS